MIGAWQATTPFDWPRGNPPNEISASEGWRSILKGQKMLGTGMRGRIRKFLTAAEKVVKMRSNGPCDTSNGSSCGCSEPRSGALMSGPGGLGKGDACTVQLV